MPRIGTFPHPIGDFSIYSPDGERVVYVPEGLSGELIVIVSDIISVQIGAPRVMAQDCANKILKALQDLNALNTDRPKRKRKGSPCP